jgi:perosamine synthetase
MSWRQVPPVVSSVSPAALALGLATACGLRESQRAAVVATLKKRDDAGDVLLTDSGTSALVLALRALVPSGGTVAYPSYGCIDLTSAALGADVRVRLYDLDPKTLSPDLDSVRKALARGVDAIVVAHLFGYPADVSAVQAIAAEYGVRVIEDAAQAAGGRLAGRRLGSLADISILSFGRGKGTTSGGGGALLVRTPALVQWVHEARQRIPAANLGGREIPSLAAQWLLARPHLYRLPASIPALRLGEMVFREPTAPRAMSAVATTLLHDALQREDHETEQRQRLAANVLARLPRASPLAPIDSIEHGEPGYLRLAMIDSLGRVNPEPALGAVRGYPLTLEQHQQLQPMLASGEHAGKSAAHLRDRLITLPTHSRVGRRHVARIMAWLGVEPDAMQTSLSPVHAS